ncbi:hypothetical protein FRC01_013024 [Tulasnella sp. 417]|nr:hypothetical protein FRC01_013024 [Tulasnella sp. 417]
MAKVVDFARVIRTASDFAFVGHTACKAASRQVLLASNPSNTIDAVVVSNIRAELARIFADSAQLIQTVLVLRTAVGKLCATARRARNDIARHHSDALATTAAIARTTDIQKFLLAVSAFSFGLAFTSFISVTAKGSEFLSHTKTAGLSTLISGLQTLVGQNVASLKKGDTEYVRKAFDLFNQLVSSLEKLEGVISGYEGLLTEMRILLISHFFDDGNLHSNSVVVWPFIEEKFRLLNEQGEKSQEFLDHYRITSDDAPNIVDLIHGAASAADLLEGKLVM